MPAFSLIEQRTGLRPHPGFVAVHIHTGRMVTFPMNSMIPGGSIRIPQCVKSRPPPLSLRRGFPSTARIYLFPLSTVGLPDVHRFYRPRIKTPRIDTEAVRV